MRCVRTIFLDRNDVINTRCFSATVKTLPRPSMQNGFTSLFIYCHQI